MKLILTMCAALVLAGCSSTPNKTDMEAWAQAVEARAKYRAMEKSAGPTALEKAAQSADPSTSLAATIALGIAEAVKAATGKEQEATLPMPKDWTDKVATVLGAVSPLVGGGLQAWATVTTVKEGGKTNRYLADQATAQQQIQSTERVNTMTAITSAMARQTEAATKNPTNVTNVNVSGTGNNSAVNGSTAKRDDSQRTIRCDQVLTANAGQSGAGGNGGQGGTGTTGAQNGGTGAPSGSGGSAIPTQQTECKIEK